MKDAVANEMMDQNRIRLTKMACAFIVVGVLIRAILQLSEIQNLASDPDSYVRLSQSIANGHGLSIESSDVPTAFRSPLFPMLLAIPQWMGASVILSISFVQLAASALLLAATWKLAAHFQLPNFSALAALAITVFDPLLLQYSTLPMTEVPSAAFLTWAIVFGVRSWTQSLAGKRKLALKFAICCGLCFGLGGLCRPIVLVACAAASTFLLLLAVRQFFAKSRPRNHPDAAPDLRTACVPAFVAALILTPWIVRNAVQFGTLIPATTHGGYTLLLGNNPVFYREVVNAKDQPRWKGKSLNAWNDALSLQMADEGIAPVDEIARDRWMYERAKANIATDRKSFYSACILRLRRFWTVAPAAIRGTRAAWAVGAFYGVLWVGLLLQSLIVFRTWWSNRENARTIVTRTLMLWAVVAGFMMIHSVYWTNTRMRAPVMPLLIVLATSGFHGLGGMAPQRARKSDETGSMELKS